jgi:hypothetical protein
MTIKQLGGVFGRNPTFNNVTIDGELIINGSVFTGLDYEGAWNASTNTPTLTSSVGTLGQFYIVSVAGATDLNGITNWDVGDWALFNGSVWQRVEGGANGNFSTLSVSGLATFGSGIDVTGTVTADGANIDGAVTAGDITIAVDDTPTLNFKKASTADVLASINVTTDAGSGGKLVIQTKRNGNTPVDRLTIDDDGNVLVGTTDTTPYNNNANSTADNGIVAGAGLFAAARYQGSVGLFNRTGSDGEILGFKRSGSAVGSISVAASVTSYNTSSDQRLKENITDADDAGSKIDAIQVRKFDWKADGSHQDYGMVAQELLEVAPEAVSAPEDPEEMMGVDYSKLVPMMLKEIQSLRARIAALES